MYFPGRQLTSTTVKAALTVLTSSYVAGTIVSSDEGNALAILFHYVPGDETSVQIKVEATNDQVSAAVPFDSNTNWNQQVTQSTSGGTTTIAPNVYSLTTSGLSNPTDITFIVNPVKGSGFRISVKATGGTPTGTYGVKAFTAWV